MAYDVVKDWNTDLLAGVKSKAKKRKLMERISKIRVVPISIAQAEGSQSYEKAREEFRSGKRGWYPHVAMHQWFTARGNLRRTGFVAKTEHSMMWRKTKKKAFEDMVKDMARWS